MYELWLEGGRLDQACCRAARELRVPAEADRSWDHPLYWANFAVYGLA